jgi:exopolyphosphatase/guanosine-5'-triphosphate,3'-diphosphate pyrophosphatase
MKVAVLDLGLGSFHLSVFETGRAGAPLVARRTWSTDPGRVGSSANPSEMSVMRGLAAVRRLLHQVSAYDPSCPVVAVASSAVRAASDGPALCDEIRRRLGLNVELLSGEGEARLSYLGATMVGGARGRVAVADLGAASLELAIGTDGECDLVHSIPLGSALLGGLFGSRAGVFDRAARERVAAMVRFAVSDAARSIWDRRPDRLVFTSFAAQALGAVADELGLRRPGARELGLDQLRRLADILAQFRPIELPAVGNAEVRSDTIAVGAVVLHTLMELLGAGAAIISPSGRREGVAVRHLGSARYAPVGDRVHTAVT